MPGVDMPLEQLQHYTGSFPAPADFALFWQAAMDKIDTQPLNMTEEEAAPHADSLIYRRIRITAEDGTGLSAKYICPVGEGPFPTVVSFHDYPMASRSWFHLSRYGAIGYAVLAPDCRGQGGESEAGKAGKGATAYGPLFTGIEDEVEKMYLYRLFTDALLWIKAAKSLPSVDKNNISVYGEGQGGALALACGGMYPSIRRCAAHYPLLCDYKRVWDMDFDTGVYEGMRYFFRWKDPLHLQEKEIFTRLSYVDAVNFAPLIHSEVLISTGLLDAVSPPSAQFAVVNGLTCTKKHLVYPKHGHELNNFFENELLKFLLA
jgi:cephalosporin-C deacetylase